MRFQLNLLLSATVLTCSACLWLIVRLCRAPVGVRQRLFPRQIWYLALTDLLFVLSELPVIVVEEFELPPQMSASVCLHTTPVFKFFRHVGLWIEIHIAVSILLNSFKVRAQGPLRGSLRFVCLPGLLLAACSAYTNPWTYDALKHTCVPKSWTGSAGPVDIADFALCLFICVGSYVTVVCRSRAQHSPSSVQFRATLRAGSYLLNALLTYGPILVCYTSSNLFENSWFRTFAWSLELSGGFINTCTYALQSRYGAALMGQPTLIRGNPAVFERASFHVDFSGGVEFEEARTFELDGTPRPSDFRSF